jgi:hypothetical protein
MNARACLGWTLLTGVLLTAGCQRLNEERTLSLMPGEFKSLSFSPPSYEQKLTVQVSSPGAPVSVWLGRESDTEAAQDKLQKEKSPDASLAGKEKAEDITLEATIPAKTGYALYIRAEQKKAEVKVKVTGR